MPITKPPVLPIWADAGDKVQPTNAELQVGWPLSATPPSRQRFNWLLNFASNAVRYFSRRGLPDYDAAETYMVGDRIIGNDDKTYRSVVDNNVANLPSTDSGTHWERWGWTQSELDNYINGKKATFIVRVASTAAINLASPGANIDGVAMVAGDLFLEKDNGTGANRGIYVWNGAAVAATRSPDADTGAELKPGVIISVAEGTANADTLWELSTDGAITIGVTSLSFKLTGSIAGALLKQTVFTASGTWTPDASGRTKVVEVEVVGGGGGGGTAGASNNCVCTAGGQGGGYARKRIAAASLGATETVTIGAGGAANTDGGNSSFGAHCTANGGDGASGVTPGSNAGTATGGDINITGQRGGTGGVVGAGYTTAPGCSGGGSVMGAGAPGQFGSTGTAAALPGGGGGGGSFGTTGSGTVTGGAGAAGIVIVREYA